MFRRFKSPPIINYIINYCVTSASASPLHPRDHQDRTRTSKISTAASSVASHRLLSSSPRLRRPARLAVGQLITSKSSSFDSALVNKYIIPKSVLVAKYTYVSHFVPRRCRSALLVRQCHCVPLSLTPSHTYLCIHTAVPSHIHRPAQERWLSRSLRTHSLIIRPLSPGNLSVNIDLSIKVNLAPAPL